MQFVLRVVGCDAGDVLHLDEAPAPTRRGRCRESWDGSGEKAGFTAAGSTFHERESVGCSAVKPLYDDRRAVPAVGREDVYVDGGGCGARWFGRVVVSQCIVSEVGCFPDGGRLLTVIGWWKRCFELRTWARMLSGYVWRSQRDGVEMAWWKQWWAVGCWLARTVAVRGWLRAVWEGHTRRMTSDGIFVCYRLASL